MSHLFNFIILTERLCVAGITLEEEGVLTIERVKKDDEGLYECIASNVEGIAKTSAVVTVFGKSLRHLEILTNEPSRQIRHSLTTCCIVSGVLRATHHLN